MNLERQKQIQKQRQKQIQQQIQQKIQQQIQQQIQKQRQKQNVLQQEILELSGFDYPDEINEQLRSGKKVDRDQNKQIITDDSEIYYILSDEIPRLYYINK